MLNNEFDPLAILEDHERKLNELINAHNEVARLAEGIAEAIVRLENRTSNCEDELNRIYNYIGENL